MDRIKMFFTRHFPLEKLTIWAKFIVAFFRKNIKYINITFTLIIIIAVGFIILSLFLPYSFNEFIETRFFSFSKFSAVMLMISTGISVLYFIYDFLLLTIPQDVVYRITSDLTLKTNHMVLKHTNNPFLLTLVERLSATFDSSVNIFGSNTIQIIAIMIAVGVVIIMLVMKNIFMSFYFNHIWYPHLQPIWHQILRYLRIKK